MQTGLSVGLSAQIALRQRLDTLAHAIANAGTVGFRAEAVRFDSLVAQAGRERLAFAQAGDTYLSRRAGGVSKTDGPLDVAVLGSGWLATQTAGGVSYTRDGRLTMTAGGGLTTLAGDPVLDAGGAPLTLDADAGAPAIARDGMITQGGRQVGALGLFALDAQARLTRAQGGGVSTDLPANPILDFSRDGVVQGSLEGSNVEPVDAMSKLVTVQRTFDEVTAALDQTDSSLVEAIKALGAG